MTSDRALPLDHLMKRQEQGKLSGSGALQLQQKLEAEPRADGVYAPITTALPVGVIPVAYIVHSRSSRCLACNHVHKWCDIFALNHLKPQWGKGGYVRNMSPVKAIEWNLPIKVEPIAQRETPFCIECIDAARDYATTLRSPPVPEAAMKLTAKATEGSGDGAANPQSKAKATSAFDLLA